MCPLEGAMVDVTIGLSCPRYIWKASKVAIQPDHVLFASSFMLGDAPECRLLFMDIIIIQSATTSGLLRANRANPSSIVPRRIE